MRPFLSLVALVALSACGPQNAEITDGMYTAFLANGSSRTLFEGDLKVDDAQNHYNIDCRALGENQVRLPDPLDICSNADGWPPRHEGWIRNDAFQVVQEDIVPWRGEAVITSEGDLQVTFHHRPPGVDMRFSFVIDPNFNPRRCVEVDGQLEWQPIDGGDWIEQWSANVDGELYLLNSLAFQFNPSQPEEEVWFLPEEWAAGYARAKFGAEDMFFRKTRFGAPAAYMAFEDEVGELTNEALFYVEGIEAGEDPTSNENYQSEVDRVMRISDEITEELTLLGVPANDFYAEGRSVSEYSTVVETNEWRPVDGSAAGLDRWIELHYNWVRIDPGSELEVGGAASGEFGLVFDASESQSTLVIAGEFSIDRIKRDRWVTGDLQEEKLEEYGTTLCEGAAP